MKKITILLIGFLAFSCQKEIDKRNPLSVAETLNKSLIKDDSLMLKDLFYKDMQDISNYTKSSLKSINKLLKKDIKNKYFDTLTNRVYNSKYIELNYDIDNQYYGVRAYYNLDSLGLINLENISLFNYSEICEDFNKSPYKPYYGIEFKSLKWRSNYSTFKSVGLQVKNYLGQDIDYIKFRLKIRQGKNSISSEDEIFNRTIEYNEKIYDGDLIYIEIIDLKDYYAGFNITKNSFNFDTELLEIRPKPESEDCVKIEELKSIWN